LSRTRPPSRRASSRFFLFAGLIAVVGAVAFGIYRHTVRGGLYHPTERVAPLRPVAELTPFQQGVVRDLDRQKSAHIRYVDGYFHGGDPPANEGVCSDVVIRSFRAAGVDLRHEVASDIASHRRDYRISKPDANIDHRRCRNLIVFFKRHAKSLPTGPNADWQPGDVVFWDTDGKGVGTHVGVIANGKLADGTPTVVHHFPPLEVSETDSLFVRPITNHFRWSSGGGR
jgi:uncharacterized protein